MHTGGQHHSHLRITHGTARGLPDAEAFLALLESLDSSPLRAARELFDDSSELFIARAPGRLDLMGGIADYSGSLVLQWPIAEATFAAVQRDPARSIKIVSLSRDAAREVAFEMSLDDFSTRAGTPADYEAARALFEADDKRAWAAYVAGAFPVLMRERGVQFETGARILIASNVPEGKGVSSSAALEVAAMSALAAAFGIEIAPRDLALLCQKVENEVAGAPCGVMDQMTSVCGVQDQLLSLLCQPAEMQEAVSLPPELAVWGLDSGVRHAVRGGDYESVRVGAFMGYRLIAEAANLKVERRASGRARVADERWRGYLSNLTPSEFETSFAARLPEQIKGDEFLARYGETTDAVTRIDPRRTYGVL
jgi:L-arabinokinase